MRALLCAASLERLAPQDSELVDNIKALDINCRSDFINMGVERHLVSYASHLQLLR